MHISVHFLLARRFHCEALLLTRGQHPVLKQLSPAFQQSQPAPACPLGGASPSPDVFLLRGLTFSSVRPLHYASKFGCLSLTFIL